MKLRALPLLAATLLGCASSTWAGRPLATDDAATADAGSCQIESWVERSSAQRTLTLAPACGLAPGWELGGDASRTRPREQAADTAALALKWAPEAWAFQHASGGWAFGLKLAAGWEHPAGGSWRGSGETLLALASWTSAPQWAVHANLGTTRDRASDTRATLVNVAAVWSPIEQADLFVEALGNDRRGVFGATVRSAGARWWLLKDRLGLDLTTHRQSGAPHSWSIGFGWYGIGL